MKTKFTFAIAASAIALSACAGGMAYTPVSQLQPTETMIAPDPIEDNSGKFMSPYTSDEVVAEWVDKSINAKLGASLGGTAGKMVGEELAGNIPFVGGFLGKSMGESVGRSIALEAAGGEEFIRETSDLSFNNLNDMSLFLFVEHSHRENYSEVLAATQEIYPGLKSAYEPAVRRAFQ